MRRALNLLPLLALFFAGCRAPMPPSTPSAPAKPIWSYWQPHLLLSSSVTHQRLEIEIDSVAGSEPTFADIQALQSFFETHCDKPAGVSIRLDPSIPIKDARGLALQDLAGRYADGPRHTNSAYACFLFYDSRAMGLKLREPFTSRTPYPATAFIDRRYVKKWTRLPGSGVGAQLMLIHEAGHLLGLTGNPAHSDLEHCSNAACLMAKTFHVRPLAVVLPGRVIVQTQLCADCLADLAAARAAKPAGNLRYRGLYIIRSEPLYQVISSPGFTFIHPGSLETLDFDWLDQRRRKLFQEKRPRDEDLFFQFDYDDQTDLPPLLEAFAADPIAFIRDLPRLVKEKQGAKPQ